jgi:ribosomal protein L7/L12
MTMTTMIKTTLERELYDALQALKAEVTEWFGADYIPVQFGHVVATAQKVIDKADGKKMGKIEMIKHARAVSGMGLKEAKDLVELVLQNAPDLEKPAQPGFDRYGYRIP